MAEAKPFIKWVGGKWRLRHELMALLPDGVEDMRHVEPFTGGGALFFARQPARALLSDVNKDLIGTYEAVRECPGGLENILGAMSRKHSKDFYYATRERFNRGVSLSRVERAAQFIYLNKTCFNGLYRVNQRGEFNVPMGSYKNPRILDAEGLLAASWPLAHAELRCAPFETIVDRVGPGDFVYLDPPYEPLSRTSSFTSYAQGGFSQDDQRRLRDVVRELDRIGAKVMLSNSDVPFIRELYSGMNINQVMASRSVNCVGGKRGKVAELVIRNYE